MKAKIKALLGLVFIFLLSGCMPFSIVGVKTAPKDYQTEVSFLEPSPALTNNPSVFSGDQFNLKWEDDDWKIETQADNFGASSIKVIDGDLVITSGNNHHNLATYKKNIRDKEIFLFYNFAVGIPSCASNKGSGSFNVMLNGIQVAKVSTPSGGSISGTIEITKNFLDDNIFDIELNGEEIDSKDINADEVLVSFNAIGGDVQCQGTNSAGLTIRTALFSRPQKNCQVDDNEVIIRDTFKAGETFAFNQKQCGDDLNCRPLSFVPTKICILNYPAIRRVVDEGADADLRGDLTEDIWSGKIVKVPDDSIIEFSYFTLFQEGIGEKCGSGLVYNKDTAICEPFLVEREPERIIIREKEIVIVGKNQVFFTDDLPSLRIITKPSTFKCKTEETIDRYDIDKCFNTTIIFNGIEFNVESNEEVSLNEYFNIKCSISAIFHKSEGITKDSKSCVLTIKSFDFINLIEIRENNNYFVIMDSVREMCIDVENTLPFTLNSEYNVITHTELVTTEPERIIVNKIIQSGISRQCFKIDSNNFGKLNYIIRNDIIIDGELFDNDDLILYNYEVVNKIPDEVKFVNVTDKQINKILEKEIGCGFWCKLINWLKGLFRI